MNAEQMIEETKAQAYAFSLHRCARCHEPIEDPYVYVLDRQHFCEECAHAWLERHRKKNRRVIG